MLVWCVHLFQKVIQGSRRAEYCRCFFKGTAQYFVEFMQNLSWMTAGLLRFFSQKTWFTWKDLSSGIQILWNPRSAFTNLWYLYNFEHKQRLEVIYPNGAEVPKCFALAVHHGYCIILCCYNAECCYRETLRGKWEKNARIIILNSYFLCHSGLWQIPDALY